MRQISVIVSSLLHNLKKWYINELTLESIHPPDMLHSTGPVSQAGITKVNKAMVCGCVYTSGMDWHRRGGLVRL